MNEHGFFTMIGLCFLLMATICVLNIQESGKIFSYDTANFQAESELQNIADSALIEAAEKIRLQPDLLPQAIQHFCQQQLHFRFAGKYFCRSLRRTRKNLSRYTQI